ncbi:hypothetical protein HMPREF9630_00667 [Peptoanaerobacter stomatis]|uniref:Glycosyltransferase, group 2 family protein n=1 Tax=Peptoanaerobacter stomatis TaxID=796937 RepID=J6HLL8_9FIRM|nr:glycosyltransferase family 2 protein [Peptoanaerobacter stomatis]EHL15298.1 hypothetical protein HMPREF9630_00667 [Peptoanaerobacter stomatis]EJU23388.1 glycosyltransferase, group 2 family protein [Peptoanaerobacter stomatis]NWO24580.1 glycosyltransferase family 2 protein [Peptostreptococcaceae bacterium oral taxon 081]
MKLSIIIINFNTYEYTKNTIKSVIDSDIDFDYEIILIDNASYDKSISKLETYFEKYINDNLLKIVKNETNIGFSRANNIGINMSSADYILLLNSDTKVSINTIKNCVRYLNMQGDNSILSCKVLLEDGTLDHACKRGFPTPSASLYYFLKLDKKNPLKYGAYDYLALNENEIGYVDVISGAFMLIPRNIIESVGVLSEDYFMYGEDIDFCYKVKENGFNVMYYPLEEIIHYKSKSRKKRKFKTIFDFHNAMWIFYKKHYIGKYNAFITITVFMGVWIKFILSIIKNIFTTN